MTSIPMPATQGRYPQNVTASVEHATHDLAACTRWHWLHTPAAVLDEVQRTFRDERGPTAPADRPACELVWTAVGLLLDASRDSIQKWYLDPIGAHVFHVTPAGFGAPIRYEAESVVMSFAITGANS